MNAKIPFIQRLLIVAILIFGTLFWVTIVMPNAKFTGSIIGLFLSGTIDYLIFPSFRKILPKIKKHPEYFGYFTHPTQVPLLIGSLWFIFAIEILLPLTEKKFGNPSSILLLLLPMTALFGLSGFLITRMNEMVGKGGRIYRGVGAKITGILGMIFFWGGGVMLVLTTIYNW